MQAPTQLWVATLLAALAGSVDAIGYLRGGQHFVSYMSGNSTVMGIGLAQLNLAEASAIGLLIVMYVSGAALGQIVADVAGRLHMPAVLAVTAGILASSALLSAQPVVMAFGMGAMNAAMNRAGNVSVSLTYATGTLVRLGQGVGHLLAGNMPGWGWLYQAAPWVGLVAGAVAGAVLHARLGFADIWFPVGAAALLAVLTAALPALAQRRRRRSWSK